MVEATKLAPHPRVRIFLKLEGFNASGSVKDRPAVYLVRDAIKSGRLGPGMTILDATSGNFGIALSMIGRHENYDVAIVAPRTITEERKMLMNFYGTKVFYTESTYTRESIDYAMRLAEQDPSYCFLYQHGNPVNPLAHYETTGVEIIEQVPDIDVMVCGLGSSGTLMGAGRRVKEHNSKARVIAIEPTPGSRIPGLRNIEQEKYSPPIFDPSILDGRLQISEQEVRVMAREAARKEGLFVGISAGAVLCGAINVAKSMKSGSVVAVLADAGWKYMSIGICKTDEG